MPASHRPSPITQEVIYRTYVLSDEVRSAVKARRQALGLTVREYIQQAVEAELPDLLAALEGYLPKLAGAGMRPARLPLSEELLFALRRAGSELDIPAGRLLLTCLYRAAGRKRRRRAGQKISQTTRKQGEIPASGA